MRWPRTGESGAAAKRSRALSNAFAVPKLTARWQALETNERSLAGVQTVEARNSAEEAQIVALLAREALEEPEQRAAIITPDRALAGRISSHLARWGIKADDTAGQPLSKTPEGVFLLNLLSAVTGGFTPAKLLALLKHPLVKAGEGRVEWLDQVRKFDLLLRGPRPLPRLEGIDALFRSDDARTKDRREELRPWWEQTRQIFEPIAKLLEGRPTWPQILAEFRKLAEDLTAGEVWARPAGRELADFLTELEARSDLGPKSIQPEELEGYFETFLSNLSVRPPYGGHPRISIYGLLEARLQQADLIICCGLNEGSWAASHFARSLAGSNGPQVSGPPRAGTADRIVRSRPGGLDGSKKCRLDSCPAGWLRPRHCLTLPSQAQGDVWSQSERASSSIFVGTGTR